MTMGPENKHYPSVFSWNEMFKLPLDQRRALLRNPQARERLRYAVENPNEDPVRGTTVLPPQWTDVYVDLVALEKNKGLEKRSIQEIAQEQGKAPGDVFPTSHWKRTLKPNFAGVQRARSGVRRYARHCLART